MLSPPTAITGCAPSVVPWLRHTDNPHGHRFERASAWRRGGRQAYLRRPTSRRTWTYTWRRSHDLVLDDTGGYAAYVVGDGRHRKLDTEFFAPVLLGFPTRSARELVSRTGRKLEGAELREEALASWSRPRPGYSSSSRWITCSAPYRRRRFNTLHWRDHPGRDDATRKSAHFSSGAGCSIKTGPTGGFAKQTRTDHIGTSLGSVTPQRRRKHRRSHQLWPAGE